MSRVFVRLNNFITRLRRTRARPGELLILFPVCLQRSECPNNIVTDVGNCKRCGKCKVSDLVALSEKHGCRIVSATGGRIALRRAKTAGVKAVVAVACGKELRPGMLGAFPKAVLGVFNTWPHGPCKDTDVELDEVERAIQWFLRK